MIKKTDWSQLKGKGADDGMGFMIKKNGSCIDEKID